MNAALRKEIRLLLPAWTVALLAAAVPVWLSGLGSVVFFAAGVLLLSLSSFGLEMSYGTFPALLAQPRPRLGIWQVKVGLLALALASVVAAHVFSRGLRFQGTGLGVVYFVSLLALMAFSGGLWATLLFRQAVTAFWFAILVPMVMLWPMMEGFSGYNLVRPTVAYVVCGYAAAGYFLARWLFLHAQDKPAQSVTNTATLWFLPAFAAPRRAVPVAALLVKELRLQDGTLVIAVLLILLHLATLVARQYLGAWSWKMAFLNNVWMLWWVVPLLVGCASVAEERRACTLESALCMPVGKLGQFAIKLLVAFGLGILLGAMAPWLLEQLRSAGPTSHESMFIGLPGFLARAAILTGIGFYASSLSGTLLQALGGAIGLIMVFAFVAASSAPVWRALEVPQSLSWCGLIAACFCLSYFNFEQLRITWRQWLRNGLVCLAVECALAILFALSYGIEYWTKSLF